MHAWQTRKNTRLQEGMAVGSYNADVNLWHWLVAFCQNQAWRFLHIGSLSDQMHLAKTWPGHPDWIWASLAEYDPGLLTILVRSGIYAPAQFWLHAGHNGHNWLKPKCFRIGSGILLGSYDAVIGMMIVIQQSGLGLRIQADYNAVVIGAVAGSSTYL